ncbi:MAG: hypothetical protein OXE99_10530 [Cellvibrionales bacterium]|nr:hypothetical protein [Cellvibrionales bacterium]
MKILPINLYILTLSTIIGLTSQQATHAAKPPIFFQQLLCLFCYKKNEEQSIVTSEIYKKTTMEHGATEPELPAQQVLHANWRED